MKPENKVEVTLSGNFQYDAGVLGLFRIFENFYTDQYELTEEYLRFDIDILEDFGFKWIKMILLQSNIFNNSIYKTNGKKNPNKKYRDEIKKIIKDTPIDYDNIEFDNRQEKLNKHIYQLIQHSDSIEKILAEIQEKGLTFVKEIIAKLHREIINKIPEKDVKLKNKRLGALENLKLLLENDTAGRAENIRAGKWIRNIIMPFNFNKGMFNVGAKEDIYQMESRFNEEFILPILALEKIMNNNVEPTDNLYCDFCGNYKVDIANFNNLQKEPHAIDRTHLFGSASKSTFSNLYWFGQPDIFFCDLCEVIMMCTIFGFIDKQKNSDLDNMNKIFIHSPSLKSITSLNNIAGRYFSFEKFLDSFLDRIDVLGQQARFVLENILFVELRAEGQNTNFQTLHLNPTLAKFIKKNSQVLKSVRGNILIKKGKKTVQINIRYQLLKMLLEGKKNIQELINTTVMETINKKEINYVSLKALSIIQHRLEGNDMKTEGVIHKFFDEGLRFSNILSDKNKQRSIVYSLMQSIRGNNKNQFFDNLFLLYMSYEERIPLEIKNVVLENIPFQNVGNAFIAGILTPDSQKQDDKSDSNQKGGD